MIFPKHVLVPSEIADMYRFVEGVRIDPDVFGALVESLEGSMFCSTVSSGKASGGIG